MKIRQLLRKNIAAMEPYSSARDEFTGKASIYLDANENPRPSDLNRYPDPLQRILKTELSQVFGIKSERIFLGNGSDEAIDLLFRAFCEPRQDDIIIQPPTYGMYKVAAAIQDIEVKEAPLKPNLQPDLYSVRKRTGPNSKLLFLCSPNNPTGNLINKQAIKECLDYFPGLVVVDEAYIDFSPGNSCVDMLENFDRLVILRTFSKAWGLAGLRLGMAFAHPEVIAALNKIKAPYNISQPTQKRALQALEGIAEMKRQVEASIREREKLSKDLLALPYVHEVFPSEANFLLVRVPTPQKLYHYLLQKGIVVRDRSRLPRCENCLRFTVGLPSENQKLLAAMWDFKFKE